MCIRDRVYGAQWPWERAFETSLPSPPNGFNPRIELRKSRTSAPTTGKVIPELKFVFWQKMFTGRFDARIWEPHLRSVLPYLDPSKNVQQLRRVIYDDLEQLRGLRNRIAHHEPIFRRTLSNDFQKIHALIALCCPITAAWMIANQQALSLINTRPP